MRKIVSICLLVLLFVNGFSYAQLADEQGLSGTSSGEGNSGLTIAGYGQIDYNQALDAQIRNNGKLDIHRIVLLFGYRFNAKTQFITEIEFEHVVEVYIEQAFLQHRISPYIDFKGGLLLIPMGIINEYHEPPSYFGVERPHIDNIISPTTWREIGAGFSGNILPASLSYQAYVVNGFSGFNGSAQLSGSKGLRSGRQKGANSYISAPNLATKVEYYGMKGLNIGLSGYLGNTQSTLYQGISRDNASAVSRADSSVVGIAMLGLDARYQNGPWLLRGQYYHVGLSNTVAYNQFTAKNGKNNDLGKAMNGYYVEVGYKLFGKSKPLIPFVRYEGYNTHYKVDAITNVNQNYKNNIITTGLNYYLARGAVLKADMQFLKSELMSTYSSTLNLGIGIQF